LPNQTGHKHAGKSKIKVSFKRIKRLYSDPEVMLAIHNLRILLFEKKGINVSNITGDGTGCSLRAKKNLMHRS